VGIGLAHGGLEVLKNVTGDAADQFAPSTVRVTMHCTSVGQDVPLGLRATVLTLKPGTPVGVFDLPYHATCSLTEGDNGQTSSTSASATVQRGVEEFETASLTNVYDFASLAVTKKVDSAAVDQDGKPIPYGPFTVLVTCTFQGQPDFAEGYDAEHPMTADLSDGKTVTFTHLHPGASCEIKESDDKGATSTTIVTTPTNGDSNTTDGTSTTIELDPDSGGHPPNTATVTNTFGVGSINVIKKVTGNDATQYGTGPFILAMKCVLDDATGSRTVWDGTIKLGGGAPLLATITDIAAGAKCTVTESETGGASTVSIDPSGPIPVDANQTATVTVTNSFDPAKLLIRKPVDGDGASSAPDSFSVKVTCSAGGSVLAGFPVTVNVTPGTPTEVDTLVGAECTAIETGEATTVTSVPPASDGSDGSGPVMITDDPQNPPTITVTNTFASSGGSGSSSDSSGQLSFTGAPITTQLLWALAALASGVALLVLSGTVRRRWRQNP
jgi:large repetitive protein